MIKSKSEMPDRGLEIDLTGPEGNAYVLLAYADRFCRQLGYDNHRRQCILDNMKLSTYDMLVHVFDKEFGSFVTLYR
jgi:hypothetical protein